MNFKKIINLLLFLILLNQVYSINTTIQWNRSINGAGNGDDAGTSIVVDSSGNSYVTGYMRGTLNRDMYITSYDSLGVHRWNKSINGAGNGDDEAKKIIIDDSGNSYLVGSIYNVNTDIYITSYDSSGTHRWNKSINGVGNSGDAGNSIIRDNSGNIYVTGRVFNANDDIYIISYDSLGVHRWNRSINGVGNSGDAGNSIVVDSSGNSYITGRVFNANDDIYIISYDSLGVHRWNRSINGIGNDSDEGISIVVDNSGDSYVTGFVYNGFNLDMYIISYDSLGVHRWNRSINGDGNISEWGVSIAVDNSGNSYSTGYVRNVNNDMYITSYDSSGTHRWNKSINGIINSQDYGNSIVVDSSGNSYVTGIVNEDMYITSYDNSGIHRWNKSIIDAIGMDYGNSIVVDSNGNSYVTGSLFNPNNNIYIIKISEDGEIIVSPVSTLNSIFPVYGIYSIIITFSLLIVNFIFN